MAKSTCSVSVCDRPRVSKGLCRTHYGWSRNHDGAIPTHGVGTLVARATCSVTACDRAAHGGGLCSPHYLWSRKNGGALPSHVIGAKRRGRAPAVCVVAVCDRPRLCGEYCGGHWAWMKLNPGREPTHAIGRSWRSGGAAAALARHSAPDPVTGCVIWTGSVGADGYGKVRRSHGASSAHRLAWLLRYGVLPPVGMELYHVKSRGCTSRACINTDHLEPVTHAENVRRAKEQGAYHRD